MLRRHPQSLDAVRFLAGCCERLAEVLNGSVGAEDCFLLAETLTSSVVSTPTSPPARFAHALLKHIVRRLSNTLP